MSRSQVFINGHKGNIRGAYPMDPMTTYPSYDGGGLVNLMCEIESRLTGATAGVGLEPSLANAIPPGETIVLVLFDGLGTAQLGHEAAEVFRNSASGTIEAGFPTTTSVSLATVATGLPPSQHGVVSHLSWMPEHDRVVNTLKWVDLTGAPVAHDYASILPRPNLWERLRRAGVEPITVQPQDFGSSPLTRMTYRGARFEGISDERGLVQRTVELASTPARFIFTYVPHVDFAGHVFGLGSQEFADAMTTAAGIWSSLQDELPPGAVLLGTADHGLVDYAEGDKLLIRDPRFDNLTMSGDPRGLHLWFGGSLADELADSTGGELIDPIPLFGPDPTPSALERVSSRMLLAPEGKALLPRGFDKRLKAYHGGLDRREVEIPLLVG